MLFLHCLITLQFFKMYFILQSRKVGRPITAPELHRVTHLRKGTNEYVDNRAKITQVNIQLDLYYMKLLC